MLATVSFESKEVACYLNSMIQTYFMLPWFVNEIMKFDPHSNSSLNQ